MHYSFSLWMYYVRYSTFYINICIIIIIINIWNVLRAMCFVRHLHALLCTVHAYCVYILCMHIHTYVGACTCFILCIHTYMSRSAYRTQKIMPRFARQWQRDTALLSGFADCLARCSANDWEIVDSGLWASETETWAYLIRGFMWNAQIASRHLPKTKLEG